MHHGTRESAAKLVELGGRFFQLRLEQPIVPAAGDRLVIRSLAPPDTLGGGVVLDPAPRRHGPSRDVLARLARLERGRARTRGRAAGPGRGARAAPLDPRALALEAGAAGRGARAAARMRSPSCSPRCASTGAWSGSGRRCTSTWTRWPTVAERVIAMEEITLAGLRDELGTSRKYAQALLEQFDGEG